MPGKTGGLGRFNEYSKCGQLWSVNRGTAAAPTNTITGGTSFVATAPDILIHKSAQETLTTPLVMRLSQSGTVAGGVISVAIILDDIDRLTSGGAAMAIGPCFTDMEAETPSFAALDNSSAITAAAASSDAQLIDSFEIKQDVGTTLEYLFDGKTIIGRTGSLLIYTWAATTGPTWKAHIELVEEPAYNG